MENQTEENKTENVESKTDYSLNTHEKLLGFVMGAQEILMNQILEVLQNPNDLSALENDYWASRGSIFHYQTLADVQQAKILFEAKGWSEYFENNTGENKSDSKKTN